MSSQKYVAVSATTRPAVTLPKRQANSDLEEKVNDGLTTRFVAHFLIYSETVISAPIDIPSGIVNIFAALL